jgi:hypothetical protein
MFDAASSTKGLITRSDQSMALEGDEGRATPVRAQIDRWQ